MSEAINTIHLVINVIDDREIIISTVTRIFKANVVFTSKHVFTFRNKDCNHSPYKYWLHIVQQTPPL